MPPGPPLSFPDGPLDPPLTDRCPICRGMLNDLDEDDRYAHIERCAPDDLKAERDFDEKHDEGRLGYQQ